MPPPLLHVINQAVVHGGVASSVKRGLTAEGDNHFFLISVPGVKLGGSQSCAPGPPPKCSRVMRRRAYVMAADLLYPPQHNELALYCTSHVMADGASILLHASVITL